MKYIIAAHYLGKSWILLVHLFFHYSAFLAMTIFFDPEKEISSGLHETVGPCEPTLPVNTAFGMVILFLIQKLSSKTKFIGTAKEKIFVSEGLRRGLF